MLHVTDGKDPDEYVKKNGRDAFLKLIDGALPYGDYKLESARIGYDLETDQGRIDYMNRAMDIVADMTPIEQEVYKQKLSRELGIAEGALDRELEKRITGNRNAPPERRTERPQEEEQISVTPLERTMLKLVMTDEDYIPRVLSARNLLTSPLAEHVMDALSGIRPGQDFVNKEAVIDSLSEPEGQALRDILDEEVLDPDHGRVFRDLLNSAEKEDLNRREKEILLKLSMAEEADNNDEMIRQLTEELMMIQKERLGK